MKEGLQQAVDEFQRYLQKLVGCGQGLTSESWGCRGVWAASAIGARRQSSRTSFFMEQAPFSGCGENLNIY
jgi:hypothetical protein